MVARAVGPPVQNERAPFTCWYYTYWSGVPMEGVEFYAGNNCTIGAVPTNDQLSLIGLAWTHSQFSRIRADIEGNYLRTLNLFPSLFDRVLSGKREERFVGIAALPSFYRKPFGSGWALVGDAGYHKDPVTAQGITDAFRDAELLAEAIDSGFSGRKPLNEALAAYETRRNEATLPMYDLTCDFAALQRPSGDLLHLFESLRGNQPDTNRFFGVMAGTVPVSQFFSQENTAWILDENRTVANAVQ